MVLDRQDRIAARDQSPQLVYSLLRLGLPLVSKFDDPDTGLAFDFLADPIPESPDGSRILAGHEHGLITINLAEANDAATAFGLRIAPNTGRAPKLAMEIEFVAAGRTISTLVRAWLPQSQPQHG
jgi:Putative zinc-binding metallo-peptidase